MDDRPSQDSVAPLTRTLQPGGDVLYPETADRIKDFPTGLSPACKEGKAS